MAKVKLTKIAVEKLSYATHGQDYYTDTVLRGFGIRVGKESKTYFCEKKVSGRTTRIVIGKHGEMSTDTARRDAQKLLGKMAGGINPVAEKKGEKAKGITLQQAFDDFLKAKTRKERTVKDYRRAMDKALKDWKNKRVVDINKDMVSKRHQKLGADIGEAQANQVMRFLRALLYFCASEYEKANGEPLISKNPVRNLSQADKWYKIPRRQTIIKNHELPAWFEAVSNLASDTVKDYLFLILFTGLRKQEGLKLRLADIDLKAKTFQVLDTKNNEPLTLPIPNHLFKIIKTRKTKVEQTTNSPYLFPSWGKSGHLKEPKKAMVKVVEDSGVQFCLHDLRRLFVTTAESMDISPYTIKLLVNHSINKSDVTAGYTIPDPERLRKAIQSIENRIRTLAGKQKKGKVVPINSVKIS